MPTRPSNDEYGCDSGEVHILNDGTAVELRRLQRSDGALIEDLFGRLSADSRHRFLGFIKELSPELLDDLTDVDERDHIAIVAKSKADGPTCTLGVARFIRASDDPTVAEFAISVADSAQGEGLGHILAAAIARAAIAHGVRRLQGPILRTNHCIHALLEEMGATFQTTTDGQDFDVRLDPERRLLR